MKEIELWIARDKDGFKDTYFYEKEPVLDADSGVYEYEGKWKGFIFESSHFGLKPGQKKKVKLVIES